MWPVVSSFFNFSSNSKLFLYNFLYNWTSVNAAEQKRLVLWWFYCVILKNLNRNSPYCSFRFSILYLILSFNLKCRQLIFVSHSRRVHTVLTGWKIFLTGTFFRRFFDKKYRRPFVSRTFKLLACVWKADNVLYDISVAPT